MNYYIYNFETDFDFEKLIIGKKINIDTSLSRYYLYYLDETPKDLFIRLPSIRLIYSYKNNKYPQIKLPIYPQYDQTKKFLNFFKSLKKIIKEKIQTTKLFCEFLEKKDNLKLLKINLSNDFKIKSFDMDLNIKELKMNSELNGLINIPYIWENENSIGLSIFAYKLYSIPKIDNDNNFLDYDKQIINNDIKEVNNINYMKKVNNINYMKETNNINYMKETNNINYMKETDNINYMKETNNINNKDNKINKPLLMISSNLLLEAKNKLNKIKV
jgi:hypothetical protein